MDFVGRTADRANIVQHVVNRPFAILSDLVWWNQVSVDTGFLQVRGERGRSQKMAKPLNDSRFRQRHCWIHHSSRITVRISGSARATLTSESARPPTPLHAMVLLTLVQSASTTLTFARG